MIQFSLQDKYFRAIKNGQKTAEGRIAKDKYLLLKKGATVVFQPNENTEQITGKVVAVNKYDSFRAMLVSEGIANMLPGVSNIDEAVGIYSSFGTYAKDVNKYGCVAIVFELDS